MFGLSPSQAQILQTSLFAALLSGSIAVWVQVTRQLRAGQEPLPYEPRETIAWSPFVVSVSLGWMVLDRVARLVQWIRERFAPVLEQPPAIPEISITSVQSNVLIGMSIVLIITTALLWQSPRRSLADYGMTLNTLRRDVLVGVRGVLAAFLPVLLVQLALIPVRRPESQHSLFKLLQAHPEPTIVFWILVAAVVVAPLMEELVFRVVLQSWLKTRLPLGTSLGVTAVAFAAIHGWPDVLPLLPLSFLLGYVYHRTHSYFAVVLLHAFFNFGNLAIALLAQAADVEP